jgi:hypothetical protein
VTLNRCGSALSRTDGRRLRNNGGVGQNGGDGALDGDLRGHDRGSGQDGGRSSRSRRETDWAGSDCGLDNIGDVNGALERSRSLGGHGVVSSSGNSDGVSDSGGNSALDSD